MSGPPPIWDAASKQWVDENFVKEADKDGKLYVRKDGDWLEIPPNANPGPYLPLSGGTVTGNLNVGSTGAGNQRNLRVYGAVTAEVLGGTISDLRSSASAEISGSNILINSFGSVQIQSNQYTEIRGGELKIKSGTWVDTGGWFNVKAGAVEIDCPSSNLVLKSSAGIGVQGPLNISGTTIIGGYGGGQNRNLTIYGNLRANTIDGATIGGYIDASGSFLQFSSNNFVVDTYTDGISLHSTGKINLAATGVGSMAFTSAHWFYFHGSALSHDGDLYIGGAAFKPSGGSWSSSCDPRLKTDVEDYTDGLEKLTQLKPIKFRFNDRARMAESNKQCVGLSAEEAQRVMPSMIGKRKGRIDYEDKEETDLLTLDSSELIYTVINALKQIDERLKKLEESACTQ